MSENAGVKDHYEREDLTAQLRDALAAVGHGEGKLTPADLAPLDQFHSRGFEATKELAGALKIDSDTKILDVGSGLGGPARYLAATYGCHVHGVDLTQSYVDAANYLAERTGLADKVTFSCADALALPYDEKSFDIVWTQHVAMNIADRARLYAEIFRVLKRGGQLAIYDVVAGANGPVHFPVPWSSTAETSFLLTPDAMRAVLFNQGFQILSWVDRTEAGITWFAELQNKHSAAAKDPTKKGLGLNLIIGPDFPARAVNLAKSMKEGKAGLLEAIVQRL